jgi:lysophospholipase
MRYTETFLKADDGHRLFVRHYQPLARRDGRTLMVAHGAAEHGQRYERVARWFARCGWDVVVTDHRGHGRSDGVPVHVRRFDRYVQDQVRVQDHLGLRAERTALLGHSMGGLVAIRFAQTYPERVSALVLTSPLLGMRVPIPSRTRALGRVLSWVAPQARFQSPVRHEDVTSCPQAVASRLRDALIHRTVTAGWFFATQSAMRAAWTDAPRTAVPLLVLQAGDERVVDPDATQQWLAQTVAADKTFRRLPGRLHEVLSEPDWEHTAEFIAGWLEARCSTAGRPTAPNTVGHQAA